MLAVLMARPHGPVDQAKSVSVNVRLQVALCRRCTEGGGVLTTTNLSQILIVLFIAPPTIGTESVVGRRLSTSHNKEHHWSSLWMSGHFLKTIHHVLQHTAKHYLKTS